MSVDVIGDFLTIIRNGVMASKFFVEAPYSKVKHEIANILLEEGFVRDVSVMDEDPIKKSLRITLKYNAHESVIHEIQRASRPGRRRYAGAKDIELVIGGLGLSIVSTSRGIISHKKAQKLNVGGEIICTVW